MSYDPNSPEARKGRLGEEIVRRYLEDCNYDVSRPDDAATSGASVVDFVVEGDFEKFLVEVKVKAPFGYKYGRFPVYTFPVSQIELYEKYRNQKGLPLALYVVDEERGVLCSQFLNNLAQPLRVEDVIFPVDCESKIGLFRYFYVDQFKIVRYLSDEEIDRLAAIKISPVQAALQEIQAAQNEPPDENAPVTEQNDKKPYFIRHVLTAPNGTQIDIFHDEEGNKIWVNLNRLTNAVGYINGSFQENSSLMLALSQVEARRHTQQIRHNETGDIKTYNLVDGEDVPKVLEQFVKITFGAKQGTKKFQRNAAATELIKWFREIVFPRFGLSSAKPPTTTEQDTSGANASPATTETLKTLIDKVAAKLALPSGLVTKTLQSLKMEHDPELRELLNM